MHIQCWEMHAATSHCLWRYFDIGSLNTAAREFFTRVGLGSHDSPFDLHDETGVRINADGSNDSLEDEGKVRKSAQVLGAVVASFDVVVGSRCEYNAGNELGNQPKNSESLEGIDQIAVSQ